MRKNQGSRVSEKLEIAVLEKYFFKINFNLTNMAVSSNSLIHYTKSFDNLIGILKNGFQVKYCSEKIPLRSGNIFEIAVPMVSFCDIPLSETKNHIDSYGHYGIGLNQKWAKRNRLNPIIYLKEGSILTENILKSLNIISEDLKRQNLPLDDLSGHPAYKEIFFSAQNITSNIKPYSGDLELKKLGKTIKNYKYYDEREWRYTLESTTNEDFFLIKDKEYSVSDVTKKKFNDKLKDKKLYFEVADISYILLNDKSEIHSLITELNNIYRSLCSKNDFEILITKIITVEQIQSDF